MAAFGSWRKSSLSTLVEGLVVFLTSDSIEDCLCDWDPTSVHCYALSSAPSSLGQSTFTALNATDRTSIVLSASAVSMGPMYCPLDFS